MQTGDIVLIPFPYAELTNVKVRPAVIVALTKDLHKDIIVCAISSVVPKKLTDCEITVSPDKSNNLRVKSVIKVDRIVTLKAAAVIASIGKLASSDSSKFKAVFKSLVD